MAKIGTIYLGGRNAQASGHSEKVNGAVAFELDQRANRDWVYRSEDGRWAAEIKAGQGSIVARTCALMSRDDIVRIGFEQVGAIDIVAFESNALLAFSDPGDSHTILYLRDGDFVVQHVGVSNLGMSIHAEVRDKEENIVPPLPSSPSIWSAPLRYYRISQTTNELNEAYRNLFLALESLLSKN